MRCTCPLTRRSAPACRPCKDVEHLHARDRLEVLADEVRDAALGPDDAKLRRVRLLLRERDQVALTLRAGSEGEPRAVSSRSQPASPARSRARIVGELAVEARRGRVRAARPMRIV